MPRFEETNQTKNNQSTEMPNQTNQNQGEQPFSQQNTGLFSLPPYVMKLVPWIPLMLEMTTGQKIPQMTGTIGEIQQGLQTIQMTLGQIIQSQQQFHQRLTNLETNASQQFTNLTNQFNSLRLTHTKEKKEIAYNNQTNLEEENY